MSSRIDKLMEKNLGGRNHQIGEGEEEVLWAVLSNILDDEPSLTDKELWERGLDFTVERITDNLQERFNQVRSRPKKRNK